MGPRLTARWLWRSRHLAAVLARVLLLPAAGLYRLATWLRNLAYDSGLLAGRALPAPSIGVGNLSVGGTGKTPLVSYLARELLARGCRPGIVLRGYGGDETAEHGVAVPEAVVVADPDRRRAARRAVDAGAEVLVLDDCLQRRDVKVDSMLVVVAAETWESVRWPLPMGPWREGVGALGRADLLVVTRKTAPEPDARALGERLARHTRGGASLVAGMVMAGLRPLEGGPAVPPDSIAGRRVTAVCGIGEPELFAAQLGAAGASVSLSAWDDHHPYTRTEVAAIIESVGKDGIAVTTAKDAVKLAPLWPGGGPPCMVALLGVTITAGVDALGATLDRAVRAARLEKRPT